MKKIFLLLLLSACSANGPVYNADLLPKGKQATVVVYKKYSMIGMSAGMYSVQVNNSEICSLRPGSYFVQESIKGKTVITSSTWDLPGTSRLTFDAKPKEIYYVRIDVNGSKEASAIGGGLIGAIISEGASSSGGPFLISLIDEAQAKQELVGLRLQEECK